MSWHRVAKVEDLKNGGAQLVTIEGHSIALFKQNGQFYALDGKCCHKGGPLVEGSLDAMKLTCPWHAWSFDLQSGSCHNMPGAKQKTYPIKIEGSLVFLEI